MRIIVWILSLYPLQWRERYQDEMLALLEQHTVTWKTSCDLLLGALDARLDPTYRSSKESFLLRWHDMRFLSYIYISAFTIFLVTIDSWSFSLAAFLNPISVEEHLGAYNALNSITIMSVVGPMLVIYLIFIPLLRSTIPLLRYALKKRSVSSMLYALICLLGSIVSVSLTIPFALMKSPISLIPNMLLCISGFMGLFIIGVKGVKLLKARQYMPVFFTFVIGVIVPASLTLYECTLLPMNFAVVMRQLSYFPHSSILYLSIGALVLVLADAPLNKQGWRILQGIGIVVALYVAFASVFIAFLDYTLLIAGSAIIGRFQDSSKFVGVDASGILIVNALILISMLVLVLFTLIRAFISASKPGRGAMVMEQMTKS